MHEMSLCEGILQILEEHAARQGFTQVKTVWLEIGALSGVDREAIRQAREGRYPARDIASLPVGGQPLADSLSVQSRLKRCASLRSAVSTWDRANTPQKTAEYAFWDVRRSLAKEIGIAGFAIDCQSAR